MEEQVENAETARDFAEDRVRELARELRSIENEVEYRTVDRSIRSKDLEQASEVLDKIADSLEAYSRSLLGLARTFVSDAPPRGLPLGIVFSMEDATLHVRGKDEDIDGEGSHVDEEGRSPVPTGTRTSEEAEVSGRPTGDESYRRDLAAARWNLAKLSTAIHEGSGSVDGRLDMVRRVVRDLANMEQSIERGPHRTEDDRSIEGSCTRSSDDRSSESVSEGGS